MTARHGSGRPWVFSNGIPNVLVAGREDFRVVVANCDLISEDLEIERHLRPNIDGANVFNALAELVGSAHVLVSEPGRITSAGDIAGHRRAYFSILNGVPVVSSSARLLGRLIGATLDQTWLAMRLCSPEPPGFLRASGTPFLGVSTVPPGTYIETDSCDATRTVTWWAPPSPHRNLRAGAGYLADSLTAGVQKRASLAQGRVSVQLSGGLDSGAISLLAGKTSPLLVTSVSCSPINDDLLWARRFAEQVGDAEHLALSAQDLPLFFADLDQVAPEAEEPYSFAAALARQRYVAAVLREHRAALNFNGQGGDEVLLPAANFLRELPLTKAATWARYRAEAALRETPVRLLAQRPRSRGSYAAWRGRLPSRLRSSGAALDTLDGWEAQPAIAPWVSRDSEELIVKRLEEQDGAPVHHKASVHATIIRIRASAYRASMYRDAMAALAVPTAMPFFDHKVVEDCLSVPAEQRADPWRFKPLLAEAMRPISPPGLFARRTKGHYDHDIRRGWEVNRKSVRDLVTDPEFLKFGLVDRHVLERSLNSGLSSVPTAFVTDLVAVARWIRDWGATREIQS